MRTQVTRGILLVCLSLYLFSFTLDKRDGIHFQRGSWSKVTNLAKLKQKPLFIFVGARYCHLSRNMERIMVNKELGDFYNSHFINTKMDPTDFVSNYRLTNWGLSHVPAILFMNSHKKILYRAEGFQDVHNLIEHGQKASAKIEEEEQSENMKVANPRNIFKVNMPKNVLKKKS